MPDRIRDALDSLRIAEFAIREFIVLQSSVQPTRLDLALSNTRAAIRIIENTFPSA